jgi:hypothetical protein
MTPGQRAILGAAMPVKASSDQSLRSLVSSVSTVARNKEVLKALKAKEKEKTKRGIVSTLFDPETGVAFAPARFGSALISDIVGVQDENLAQYNPLESAFRSAKGEFAITGGDIFKTKEGESIVSRLPKLGAALAYDIFTDPLNYVGGVGVFARGQGAALAADEKVAGRLLNVAKEAVAAKGRDPEEVTKRLFKISRVGAAGKQADNIEQVATGALGDIIGESFLKQGRGGILADLTNIFNDADVARAVFEEMPDPIRGGLFLKNPITGRPLARIAGGRGYSNAFLDYANEARFRLSASKAGQAVTRTMGGKLGPALAAVKYGLIDKNNKVLGEFGRTRLSDFVTLRNALAQRGVDIRNLPEKFIAQADRMARRVASFSEDDQQLFRESMTNFFYYPDAIVADNAPEVVKAAKAVADELNSNFDDAQEYFQALGLDIGVQKNFKPLKYSDEHIEKLKIRDPRQGPETRDRYNGQLERVSYGEPAPVKELDEIDEELKFMNPVEANRVVGENRFETDPIKLLAWYSEWMARTVANNRMVRTLENTGVLMSFPSEVLKVLNVENAKYAMSAIKQLSPEAVKRVEDAAQTLKAELDDMVSEKNLAKRSRQRAKLVNSTEQAYLGAKRTEEDIRRRLVELDRIIRALDPNDETVAKAIRWYGSLQLEATQDAFRGMRRERARRAARLAKAEGKVVSEADIQRRIKELGEGWSGDVDIYDPATGKLETVVIEPPSRAQMRATDKKIRELDKEAKGIAKEREVEMQSVRDLDVEIAETKALIEDTSRQVASEDIVGPFREYLDALQQKRDLTLEYDAARAARREAKKVRDAALNDVTVTRRKGISITIDSYVTARQNYLEYISKLRGVAKENWTEVQTEEVKALKSVMDTLRKDLKERLGFAGKNSKKPGAQFAATVMDLADRLTVAQMQTARVIADSQQLDTLMERVVSSTISRDQAMTAMNDLMRTYRSIRRYVTSEQLNELGAFERAAYDGVLPLYERASKRYTAKADILEKDLRAAIARSAPAEEIEALEKQLDTLNRLTDENGMRLLGAGVSGVRIPKYYEDIYAPKGVRDVLERMYRIEQDPTDWEKFINKVYDPFALVWKTAATVGRGPSYTLNNTVGGLFNNWLGGVTAREHAVAAKVVRAYLDGVSEAKKLFPKSPREQSDYAFNFIRKKLSGVKIGDADALEVFDEFMAAGNWLTTDTIFTNEQLKELGLTATEAVTGQKAEIRARFLGESASSTEERMRRSVNFLLTNPVQRWFNDAAQASEVFLRFAAFSHSYRQYGSRWAATDFVHMLHFDYQDLSDAEMWIKRLAPFYTWTRHNVPLQLRAMFLQQDKLRKAIMVNYELGKIFGADDDDSWINDVLPSFLDINGGFASMIEFGGNHLAFFPKLPFNDIDQLIQVTDVGGIPILLPRFKQLGQSLGPAVAPLEFLTQTSFDTGQQYEGAGEAFVGVGRSLVPYLGTAQRLTSAATIPFTLAGVDIGTQWAGPAEGLVGSLLDQEKGLSNLFNFLAAGGVGATTITEKTLKSGLIQRSKAQSKQIKELADKANVDVEWLRSEIKKGVTPQQLQIKISMGYGDPERVARRKQSTSPGGLSETEKNALSVIRRGQLGM